MDCVKTHHDRDHSINSGGQNYSHTSVVTNLKVTRRRYLASVSEHLYRHQIGVTL